MSEVTVRWKDGKSPIEVMELLEEFDEVLSEKLVNAVETSVMLIEATAKELAPVDTGRLRSSIASEVTTTSEEIIEAYVGSNVEYAYYQEFGTSIMNANPYLRPAFDIHYDDVERLVGDAIEDSVQEVF